MSGFNQEPQLRTNNSTKDCLCKKSRPGQATLKAEAAGVAIALSENHPDENEDQDSSETAASEFLCSVAGDNSSPKIVHIKTICNGYSKPMPGR